MLAPDRERGDPSTGTNLVLRYASTCATKALETVVEWSRHESIALKALVLLNMFRKLTEWVPGRRAFRATQKRHREMYSLKLRVTLRDCKFKCFRDSRII